MIMSVRISRVNSCILRIIIQSEATKFVTINKCQPIKTELLIYWYHEIQRMHYIT